MSADFFKEYNLSDREKMIQTIITDDNTWHEPEDVINFGDFNWRPHLVDNEGNICHIHTTNSIIHSWQKRIEATIKNGKKVFVAGPEIKLCKENVLLELNKYSINPILLRQKDADWELKKFKSVSELIYSTKLVISTEIFQAIAENNLSIALSVVSNHEKGWRFEDLLALIFSQTRFFEVIETNYNNSTEEIDIVLKNNGTTSLLSNSPIVLVSAKNKAKPIGSDAYRSLSQKMDNRNNQCKIGFLCAAKKIASTLKNEILRQSKTDKIIVPIDGKKLKELIQSKNLDEELERTIIDVILE